MTGFGTKAAALAAMLLGLAASGMAASGTAAAGHAGYGHAGYGHAGYGHAGYGRAGTYGRVSGAKIHITLGAAPLAFGKLRHHGQRGRHGHHRLARGHAVVPHGARGVGTHGLHTLGVATSGVSAYAPATHGLASSRIHGRVRGGCRPTSKVVFVGHGRRAKVGGLMCHDRRGRPFVLPGSRHVLFYY